MDISIHTTPAVNPRRHYVPSVTGKSMDLVSTVMLLDFILFLNGVIFKDSNQSYDEPETIMRMCH